jgi:serine/threonine protein kinase/formylglycine-generating enzyme required for sulfatase activity
VPYLCPRCDTEVPQALFACPRCGEQVTEFLRTYSVTPLDSKYHMLSLLGVGGMGEVYKAIHVHLEALRVIKLMRGNLVAEPGVRERFLREARLATKIQHPNVAALFDFSSLPDGSWYMVWEFIDGINLAKFVRERGRLQAGQAVRLAIQTLQGLDAVHKAGIVHRDISPENIMITTAEDGAQRVKIIDLGVAKASDDTDQQTKTGMFVGKLKYASPEQLGSLKPGEKIDGRSDLYSFGLVLYEMLTGVPPFQAETPHQYLVMHVSQPPRPMRQANPDANVPPSLEAVILKAVEKNRNNRYRDAEEFAHALAALPLQVLDTPTEIGLRPDEVTTATPLSPTPSPELTRPSPREPSRTPSTGSRSLSSDPTLARRRELLDQVSHDLSAQQIQQAHNAIQNLRMHLGARAEGDPDFRKAREEVETAAADLDRWYTSEIVRARDNGQPREVKRLLEERDQRLGRKLSDGNFRIETDHWLRRRRELLDRVRTLVNAESFGEARELLDDLSRHLGLGGVKDDEFVAVEQSCHHALRETEERLRRSIAKGRDARDVDGVEKLLRWRDAKLGPRVETPAHVNEAQQWVTQMRARDARGPQLSAGSGGGTRRVAMILFFLVVLGGVAAWIWREPLMEYVRGVAPEEAKNVIQQIRPVEPVPVPVPVRRPDQPPLLGEGERARAGHEWTSPKDGLRYVWIPQTWYLMGCASLDERCEPDEKPAHTVGVTGLWLGVTEVPVAAWRTFVEATMPDSEITVTGSVLPNPIDESVLGRQKKGVGWVAPLDPKSPAAPEWPVTQVTWDEAAAYCAWIGGRLPTEAEWEMAARERERRTVFPWGDAETPTGRVASLADADLVRALRPNRRLQIDLFAAYSDGFATFSPVDAFPPNALGIAGLPGNAWEWTGDWYGGQFYAESPEENPKGPVDGELRVVRGGSWASVAAELRASNRRALPPDTRSPVVGFRCAFDE